MMDMSCDMIQQCKEREQDKSDENIETLHVVGDEEFLPMKERCRSGHNFYYIVYLAGQYLFNS